MNSSGVAFILGFKLSPATPVDDKFPAASGTRRVHYHVDKNQSN